MEKCRSCQAELEEGVTVCPVCGKDNAEAPAEQTSEVPAQEGPKAEKPLSAEIVPGKKASPALIAAMIILIVALAAAMVALVIGGMDKAALEMKEPTAGQVITETVTDDTDPQDTVIQETEPPTVPEGNGDPTSVSYKGTYTVSSEDVVANKDTVIATAGDFELTIGQLQIYYWQEVSGFMNQYGYYASSYGLDLTLPLDAQFCPVMEGLTWQQYFLYSALNSWHSYQALDAEAEEQAFPLPQEYVDQLDGLSELLEEQAANAGFDSAQGLMTYNVGSGPDLEDYAEFMEIYYHGYAYFNDFYTNVTASEEEIEEMFALHEEEYAEVGLTKETKTVDVRHILIYPEGATSETIRTETFSEEAWAAGKASAEAILEQWLAGDKTEESFAALAGEHSQDPGSAASGGLYTDVNEGMMVTNFNDWCFDPARQVGDYGIVETEFGYHIMFYSGETFLWTQTVEQDVISQKTNDMVDAALAKYPLTVYYDRILLSMAEAFRVN